MVGACIDEPECVADTSNLAKIFFYKYPGDRLDTLLVRYVFIEGTSDTIYQGGKRFKMDLPLNPGTESIPITVSRRGGGDTLFFTINYGSIPGIISEECGMQSEFSLQSVSNTMNIDSVAIINRSLDVEKNIEIYRKDCSTNKTSGVFVSFHDYTSEELTPLMIDNVAIANDNDLYYTNSENSKIYLPLNPDFTSLPIVVSQSNVINQLDFTINYKTESFLISDWCGEGLSYTLTEIANTSSNIDSIAIVHTNLSSKFDKNIEIYLTN